MKQQTPSTPLASPTIAAAAMLAILVTSTALAQRNQWPPAREPNAQLLARQGLTLLAGKHLKLVTDLPLDDHLRQLPAVFDAAVPAWAQRFEVEEPQRQDWQVLGCLIGDQQKFAAANLLPPNGRDFLHGLSLGNEFWLHQQATPYYTRHLLLHEGTHSFMATQLGGCGPGWYMEGMAELLGQHTWTPATRALRLGVMLPDGHHARSLGRVGLLQQAFAQKRALTIPSVMQIDNRESLENEAYAWVWALAKFLDAHPRYQQRFGRLHQQVLDQEFNQHFRAIYHEDWQHLTTEWRVFVSTLQYGHDVLREAIDFQPGRPLDSDAIVSIQADRGWQSTRVLVQAGKRYAVTAKGRFTIMVDPDGTPIESEAGGVTLDYHAGSPLGMLLAAIDPRDAPGQKISANALGGFLRPAKLGRQQRFTAPYTGTLYLRMNDSPARLSENAGELSVKLTPAD